MKIPSLTSRRGRSRGSLQAQDLDDLVADLDGRGIVHIGQNDDGVAVPEVPRQERRYAEGPAGAAGRPVFEASPEELAVPPPFRTKDINW